MMRNMSGPQEIDAMRTPMIPIRHQINKHKRQQPLSPIVRQGENLKMRLRKLQTHKKPKQIKQSAKLINGTNSHIHYRIRPLIHSVVSLHTKPPFKGYQKQKNRNQQGDVIGHIFRFYEFPPTQKLRCTENSNRHNKIYGTLQAQCYNQPHQKKS